MESSDEERPVQAVREVQGAATATVRPMTAGEFENWTVNEVESYAVDIAEASGIDLAEARRQSAEQTAGLLPEGLATPGVHLLRVLDPAGVPAGMLWIGAHPRRPEAGWIYDIVIDEERRGEGLGRAAMLALRKSRARSSGQRSD